MIVEAPTLDAILGLCLAGWSSYLSSEKNRIVKDIKEIKRSSEEAKAKAQALAELVPITYLTKTEHTEFDNRISRSVDRLSERIDRVLDQIIRTHNAK